MPSKRFGPMLFVFALMLFLVLGCASLSTGPAVAPSSTVEPDSPAACSGPSLIKLEIYRMPDGNVLALAQVDEDCDGKCDFAMLGVQTGVNPKTGKPVFETIDQGTCEQGDDFSKTFQQYLIKARDKPAGAQDI